MAQQPDPPGRVARLNHVQGPVVFSPAGDNEWTDAVLNRPLTHGDRVWTDRGSRAEIQVGSSAVRMDGQTHLEILVLDDQSAQLSVTQGTVYVRVRSLPEGENFEIDTPNLAYRAAYPGDYRVDVDASRATTRVTIHSGTGAVYGENGQALPLGGGQQITFRGRALAQLNAQESPPQDTFDRWAAERNRLEDQAISARFVPREVVGYQQLDAHGRWAHDVTHGMVWFPQGTAANWAPYRHGHWEWISPWGWTWIDDAPWGFAPFHYGRWTMIESRWAWVPGRLGLRPVYAPALVAFIGGSAGATWKIGSGIAWFPLGPGEAFQPGYRASPVYISNVNRNITVQADAGYAYQRSVEALTAISAEDFHRGKPMRGGWLRVAANTLTSAQIVPPPPMPERRELVAHQRAAPSRVAPPAEAEIRKVIATSVPASPPENVQRVPSEREATHRDAQRQARVQGQAQAQANEQAQGLSGGAPQEVDAQPRQSAEQDRAQRRLARRAERAKREEQARLDQQAAREQQAKANPPSKTAEAAPPNRQVAAAAEQLKRAEQSKALARREQLALGAEQSKREKAALQAEQAKREHAAMQVEQARREQVAMQVERAKQRAKSAEQARREQASLRAAQVKREQTTQRAEQARREQIALRAEQAKRDQQAKSANQARREQLATRAEQAKREQVARRAEQAKRDQAARRTEVARREQARREQLALRAEQARRVEQARHEEQLRRDARAQQVEQARRAAERDAQALREQRHQREEQARLEEQARRDALARREAQERELAQREAWQRQQQAVAEQWRRDQQLWEQQQRDRVRQRPYLRDDRRQPPPQPEIWQRGIPILNPGRTS